MTDSKSYADLVGQAEQAVKNVADPELRRVAFDKILSALLDQKTIGPQSPLTQKPKTPAKAKQSVPKKVSGPRAYVRELSDEGFFKKPKSIAQVKAELENRGHHIPITSLSGPLQALCQAKVLRRQKTETQNKQGKKQIGYAYSEW